VSIPLTSDPFIFTLALKAVPQAAVLARQMIADAFDYWGLGEEPLETGKLVTSELVSNAVAASAEGQEITLRTFLGEDGSPIIEVWDDVDDLPVLRHAGEDDEFGRGLTIVEALTKRWGTNAVVGGGKVVWAVVG
jgi:anti-sigma regulatory factor (Ser/Thr protein kinase)